MDRRVGQGGEGGETAGGGVDGVAVGGEGGAEGGTVAGREGERGSLVLARMWGRPAWEPAPAGQAYPIPPFEQPVTRTTLGAAILNPAISR